jgi:uncharacterized protein with PIN domain
MTIFAASLDRSGRIRNRRAHAAASRVALLIKGDDFSKTDVERAG